MPAGQKGLACVTSCVLGSSKQQVGVGPAGHRVGGCESGRAYSRRVGCGNVCVYVCHRGECVRTWLGACAPYRCVHRETGQLGVLPCPSISSP